MKTCQFPFFGDPFFLSFALVQLTFAGSERARRLKSKKLLIRNQKMTARKKILFIWCPVTGARSSLKYNQFDCVLSVKSPKNKGGKRSWNSFNFFCQ